MRQRWESLEFPFARCSELAKALPALRYALGNTGALLLGLTVAYLCLRHTKAIGPGYIRTGDFIAYFSSFHLVATGHGGHLFDLHRLGQMETSLVPSVVSGQTILMPYLYLPYLSVLLSPLGLLPYDSAFVAWLVINCLLLTLSLYALEHYSGLTGRSAMVARFGATCSIPVLMALLNGQSSLLILAFLVIAFFAARHDHQLLTGAALALASIKLPYVAPILLVFLVRRNWGTLLAYAGAMTAVLALPMVVLGVSINRDYFATLLQATHWSTQYGYQPARSSSFAGFAGVLLPHPLALVAQLGLTLVAVSLLLYQARRASGIEAPFGLAVVVALLINPHVLIHDLVLALIPLAVVLRYRRLGSRRAIVALSLGWLSIPIGYGLVYTTHLQLSTLALSCLALCLALSDGSEVQGRTEREKSLWRRLPSRATVPIIMML